MKKDRYTYIDAAKGVGAILVIIGHLGINYYLTLWIYMFHMPLFFFISGFLEKEPENLKIDIVHKAQRILYPYFSFGILLSVIFSSIFDFCGGNYRHCDIMRKLVALLYGNYIDENNYNNTLWFLAALFSTYLLFRTVNFLSKNNFQRILYICISVILGLIAKNILISNNGIRLPWCIDIALFALAFYMGGYYYKKYENKFYKYKVFIVLFGGGVGTCIGVVNLFYMNYKRYKLPRVDMLHLNFGFIPFFLCSAFCIIVALLEGLKILCSRYHIRIIERIGQYSLLFMVIHPYVIKILKFYDIPPVIKLFIVLIITYFTSNAIGLFFPSLYKRK